MRTNIASQGSTVQTTIEFDVYQVDLLLYEFLYIFSTIIVQSRFVNFQICIYENVHLFCDVETIIINHGTAKKEDYGSVHVPKKTLVP
jgi:hypothetical protein